LWLKKVNDAASMSEKSEVVKLVLAYEANNGRVFVSKGFS